MEWLKGWDGINMTITKVKYPKSMNLQKQKRWLKRNVLWFVLLAIISFSFGTGLVVGKLATDKPEPVLAAVTATAVPTPKTVIDTEPVTVYFDIPLSKELQDYIRNLCDEYCVPIELVIAIIDVESSFRTDVVSKTNDYGLMQINTINHEWLQEELGITDFLDPYQNVMCGIYIISGHLEKTDGDIELALMRYNCGATGAKRLWDKGIYHTDYTRKIMGYYEFYKEESRPTDRTP